MSSRERLRIGCRDAAVASMRRPPVRIFGVSATSDGRVIVVSPAALEADLHGVACTGAVSLVMPH